MANIISIRGRIEECSSKHLVRFIQFGATSPYNHTLFIEVGCDPGMDTDDALTAALEPFCNTEVLVAIDIDDSGDAFATPASFQIAAS